MTDKLRINTLHRFAKHSERLVVQQFSHCEVPAGCGGYVMRWHDPEAGAAILLRIASAGRFEGFLDGEPIESGRFVLRAGEHLLALHFSGLPRSSPLAVAAAEDVPEFAEGAAASVLVSAGDGTWRAVRRAPDQGWQRLDFDDARWDTLEEMPLAPEVETRWEYRRALEVGARALRLRGREAWVRRRIAADGDAGR